MKSIRGKFLVIVISALFIMTAIVATISVSVTHVVLHKDADRILENMCQKEAAYINEILHRVKKTVTVMEHYATTELPDVSFLQSEANRDGYLQKLESMFGEFARSVPGMNAFYARLNPDLTTPVSGFFLGVETDGSYTPIPMTDMSLYHQDDVERVGWYYEAVKAGQGIWMQPYTNKNVSRDLISYVAPFYKGGQLAGIVGADIDFEWLVEYISDIQVYENGYAILIGEDGKTYCHDPLEEHRDDEEQPHTHATVLLDNGMSLELHANYKDIQKELHPILVSIVYAFILVLAVFIVLTVLVTNKIIAPLKKLTIAAQSIAQGAKDVNLNVDSNDEIGVLANVLSTTYDYLKDYTTHISGMAYRDVLTGIGNYSAYTEVVTQLKKKMLSGNPAFAVFIADMNNLKEINDHFGHNKGNDLIIHVVKILSDIFQNSSVFRIGGDEFVVLLESDDYANRDQLIRSLDQVCAVDRMNLNGVMVPVSIARGVAAYDPDTDKTYEDVFSKADQAMYVHKSHIKKAPAS